MIHRTFAVIRVTARILSPVVIAVITYFSLIPGSDLASRSLLGILGDKGAHMLAYVALGFFLTLSFSVERPGAKGISVISSQCWRFLLVWGVTIMVGSIIEIVQPFFQRGFEVLDIVADGIGSLAGILLAAGVVVLIHHWDRKREST